MDYGRWHILNEWATSKEIPNGQTMEFIEREKHFGFKKILMKMLNFEGKFGQKSLKSLFHF